MSSTGKTIFFLPIVIGIALSLQCHEGGGGEGGDGVSFMLDKARRYTAMTDSDFEELAEERNEEGQAPRVFKVPTSSSPMEEEEEDLERHRRHHNGGLAGFFSRGHCGLPGIVNVLARELWRTLW